MTQFHLLKRGTIFVFPAPNKRATMTDNKLSHTHIEILKSMHAREERRLTEALIDGAGWEEVQELRTRVTELAAAIHQKLYPASGLDPAAFRTRDCP